MGHEFDPLSREVIAAAIEVHTESGPGFRESIYENAMHVALDRRGIVHERQKDVRVIFQGIEVGQHKLDLIVDDELVVELKAIKDLNSSTTRRQ
jgi:GxxExxY protein